MGEEGEGGVSSDEEEGESESDGGDDDDGDGEEESEGVESEEGESEADNSGGEEQDAVDEEGEGEEGEGEESFSLIRGVAVDGTGCAWVLDWGSSGAAPQEWGRDALRILRVDLGSGGSGGGGRVSCVVDEEQVAAMKTYYLDPTILRNGFLAMVSLTDWRILLLDLELTPTYHGRSSCSPHTLSSDLGALLARQPDGSADVEVEVGGQVFAAHRSVLAARSPYFRQRLDPGAGFADAGGPRLSLPDADPGAFAAVLRYMYTDSAGSVPPELLQPVGELADRLLLPGLCTHVGQQLLGTVCAQSVVDLLLWAEQRRGSFGALLGGLKDWFLKHHAAGSGRGWVLSDDEVLRLMQEGRHLAMELLYHQRPDVRGYKRQRGE